LNKTPVRGLLSSWTITVLGCPQEDIFATYSNAFWESWSCL